jgi:hypothetical protein
MHLFSFLAKLIVGLICAEVGRDGASALMPHKRVPNCCDSVSKDVNEDKGISADVLLDDLDIIVCFLEKVEGITRELCNLLLRTCSNKIDID